MEIEAIINQISVPVEESSPMRLKKRGRCQCLGRLDIGSAEGNGQFLAPPACTLAGPHINLYLVTNQPSWEISK